jgi:D-aspartate ligase
MKAKAVILGSNYFIALSILRSLGPKGIHCVALDHNEENAYAFLSKYVNEKVVCPHYLNQENELVDFLVHYSQKQETKPVLFPCADNYVEFIDRHLNQLKDYYLIPMTQQGLYTQVMNKDTLADLALQHHVRLPRSLRPSEENFLTKVETEIGYPVLIKPVDSPAFTKVFRQKSFVAKSQTELETILNKVNEAKLEIIVQQIIEGFDDHMYTYDAYMNQNSEVTHWVTCNKFRQYPINFGASSFTIQKYVPELHEIGAPFFKAMGYKGFAEIEFKKDAKDGQFYLIEINVRTTTLNSMLEKAGVNFPYVQYKELTGDPLEASFVDKDTNIAFWFEVEDLYAIRDYLKTKQLKLRQIIPTFFRPLSPAVFDIKDMKPFFRMLKLLIKRIYQRRVKRK